MNDTIRYNWRNSRYLAAGLGYFLSFYDPPWSPYEELLGCIIDGRRYGTPVGVSNGSPDLPSSYRLYSSFPNPFNPSTTISHSLSASGNVNVSVYDILGRTIATLVDEFQTIGFHAIQFVPKNLSSGVYFVRLTAGHFTATNKILYSK